MTEKSMMANVIWLTKSERDKQKLKRKTRTTKTAAANHLCVRGSVYQLEYVNTDGKHEIKQVGDLLHVNKMIASKQLQSFKPNPEAYFMLEWNLMGHELFNALKDKMTESNKAQP